MLDIYVAYVVSTVDPVRRKHRASRGPRRFDAADDWIAEWIGAKDIAITADTADTADIPLAARRPEKGAKVI